MGLVHVADYAGVHPFGHLPAPVERIPLVSHLCGHLVFFRQSGQQSRFIDGVGQRFLYIGMFSQGNGMCRYPGMGMVGGCHHDGIDGFIHLVEHHPPVLELPGFRVVVECFGGIFPVNIAEGHDVFCFHVRQVATPHSSHADTGNVEFVTWGGISPGFPQYRVGDNGKSCGSDGRGL
ncbi:hypothetical protein SDC9_94659 [bioreactor metagenome]|uniref:Uncharacterized protein n=1 Tax=bioreactor metagenome TaxID=1076179 RepID=A0A645A5G6_9ZZZZ